MRSSMYPRFYQNDFHFQTDGWFSSNSARCYDASTEALFMGRQDAMQRTTLIPISRCAARSFPAAMANVILHAQPNKFAHDSVVRIKGCKHTRQRLLATRATYTLALQALPGLNW